MLSSAGLQPAIVECQMLFSSIKWDAFMRTARQEQWGSISKGMQQRGRLGNERWEDTVGKSFALRDILWVGLDFIEGLSCTSYAIMEA
jgi:hypothetical protein